MCGRYVTPEEAAIERYWKLARAAPLRLPARFNVAPTQAVPLVVPSAGGDPQDWTLTQARWGLVPAWWRKADWPSLSFNARSEEAEGKPMWREPWRRQRGFMPAQAWYEWNEHERLQGPGGRPRFQPYVYEDPHGEPLAMAALWSTWLGLLGPAGKPSPQGEAAHILSCALVSRRALDEYLPIHDRMPVLLDAETLPLWMDPQASPEMLRHCVRKPRPGLRVRRVSPRVNRATEEGASLLEDWSPPDGPEGGCAQVHAASPPAQQAPSQTSLFD